MTTESHQEIVVSVVSSRSEFCDVAANIRHFEAFAQKARQQGSRLVCFPELALSSYSMHSMVLDVAEQIPGPSCELLSKIASRLNVFISMGIPERAGRSYYITQVVVGPDGYVGKYRKHHLTDTEMNGGFSPGSTSRTFQIDGFRFGINICYDGRFPDTINLLKTSGVDAVLHPHGNYIGLGDNAEEWTRGKLVYFASRALYARAYMLINNSGGDTVYPEGRNRFSSGAMVIDPLGQVMKRTSQRTRSEKMITVRLVRPLSRLIPDFELKRKAAEFPVEAFRTR